MRRAGPARDLNRAASILAASVLLDSFVEHYRGSFRNPAMVTPIAVASLSLAASAHGLADRRDVAHRARRGAYGAAALTGLIGSGFHLYNVLKRPGRMAWQNLFYGAPVGAPMALLLAGLLGTAAEASRDARPRLFGLPAGRLLAAVSGAGLLGTTGEAGLLHFRGAFQNPFMYAPVTVPPVGGALLLGTAATGWTGRRMGRLTRWWLRIVGVLGLAGVGFHAFGVHRAMGGWRNWRQNVLDGPPIPAPPSFSGLALAGLAALRLIEPRDD